MASCEKSAVIISIGFESYRCQLFGEPKMSGTSKVPVISVFQKCLSSLRSGVAVCSLINILILKDLWFTWMQEYINHRLTQPGSGGDTVQPF